MQEEGSLFFYLKIHMLLISRTANPKEFSLKKTSNRKNVQAFKARVDFN